MFVQQSLFYRSSCLLLFVCRVLMIWKPRLGVHMCFNRSAKRERDFDMVCTTVWTFTSGDIFELSHHNMIVILQRDL